MEGYKIKISKPLKGAEGKPTLRMGGNPQIAKADDDAPVQTYIEGMPGWKRDVGRRFDELITRNVPNINKAVNKMELALLWRGRTRLVSQFSLPHQICQGGILQRDKAGSYASRRIQKHRRTVSKHHEDDLLDEEIFTSWVRQAAALPGWVP